jgi:predicted nucleic acid-binding protein
MASRSDAYVDTSALIALSDDSDTWHALFRRLFADPPKLVTTSLVLAEAHAWFLRRYDAFRALQFLSRVETMSPLEIALVGEAEHQSGIQLLRRFSDQDLTLTDAIGIHVMKARQVRFCWSTDRHLGITGVPLAIDDLS